MSSSTAPNDAERRRSLRGRLRLATFPALAGAALLSMEACVGEDVRPSLGSPATERRLLPGRRGGVWAVRPLGKRRRAHVRSRAGGPIPDPLRQLREPRRRHRSGHAGFGPRWFRDERREDPSPKRIFGRPAREQHDARQRSALRALSSGDPMEAKRYGVSLLRLRRSRSRGGARGRRRRRPRDRAPVRARGSAPQAEPLRGC